MPVYMAEGELDRRKQKRGRGRIRERETGKWEGSRQLSKWHPPSLPLSLPTSEGALSFTIAQRRAELPTFRKNDPGRRLVRVRREAGGVNGRGKASASASQLTVLPEGWCDRFRRNSRNRGYCGPSKRPEAAFMLERGRECIVHVAFEGVSELPHFIHFDFSRTS